MTRKEKERRENLSFLIAVIAGCLLIAGGLFAAAAYNTMNLLYAIPAIICFAVAAFLGNRFSYLFE